MLLDLEKLITGHGTQMQAVGMASMLLDKYSNNITTYDDIGKVISLDL